MQLHQQPTNTVPTGTPRKSGLTDLDLALMGKGVAQSFRRPMTAAESDAFIARRNRATEARQ